MKKRRLLVNLPLDIDIELASYKRYGLSKSMALVYSYYRNRNHLKKLLGVK